MSDVTRLYHDGAGNFIEAPSNDTPPPTGPAPAPAVQIHEDVGTIRTTLNVDGSSETTHNAPHHMEAHTVNETPTNTAEIPSTPMTGSGPALSVEPRAIVVKTTTKLPEKERTLRGAVARFRGFSELELVAREKLERYDMPSNRVKLTVEALQKWLPILGLTERTYARLVDMGLEKSVKWNAHWPLVSWLGLVAEMKEEVEHAI